MTKPMTHLAAIASFALTLAGLNFAENAHATNIYVKYGATNYCKVMVTAGTDIFSDTLGGTFPVGTGISTSAGDQYLQGTLDSASCGVSTGGTTPAPIFAISTAALIVATPSNLQGNNNATTLSWAMQNATQCTASATFTAASGGSPAAVSGISGWPTNFCSTAGTCNGSRTASLTGLATAPAGTYALTLTCSNTSNAPVASTAVVNVTPIVAGNCPSPVVPAGISAQTSVAMSFGYPQGTNEYIGNSSDFGSMFGRAATGSSSTVVAGETAWPGVSGAALWLTVNHDQYISIPFVPAAGRIGAYKEQPNAEQQYASISISLCPGDFRITPDPYVAGTTSVLGSYCSRQGYNANSVQLYWDVVPSGTSPICHLTAGQTYYLNIIQAPLADSTAKPSSMCAAASCSSNVTNTILN
jgi:hypothetical protein